MARVAAGTGQHRNGWLPKAAGSHKRRCHGIVGVIVAGIIIGLLGKVVAPGRRDNTPLWLTILCGIGGVLIGWFIYTAFHADGSTGIDWIRWLIAIAVAARVLPGDQLGPQNLSSEVGEPSGGRALGEIQYGLRPRVTVRPAGRVSDP